MELVDYLLIVTWLIAQVAMMVIVTKMYCEFEAPETRQAMIPAVGTVAIMTVVFLLLLYPVFSRNMTWSKSQCPHHVLNGGMKYTPTQLIHK